MTRDELARELQAITAALNERVEVWRVIIDEHGKELRRIYRGSFTKPRPVASNNRRQA